MIKKNGYNVFWFTLVELIVTISVLIVLSAIWFTSFSWYIASSRDSMRIAQMSKLTDTLEIYKLTKILPLPDSYTEIKDGTEIIAYQWYAWDSVLSTLWVEKKWGDFEEWNFYSYYLTKNRKNFQLLTFLEEEKGQVSSRFLSYTYAEEQYEYPYITWQKLWIITDSANVPIHEKTEFQSSGFDISTTTDDYIIYLSNEEKLEGGVSVLQNILTMSQSGGKYCRIDLGGVICEDSNISEYQKYPDCPAWSINSSSWAIFLNGFVNEWIAIRVTWIKPIDNGTNSYSAIMYCDKWVATLTGETLVWTVCNQWYTWNGVQCEPPDLYAFTTHTFTNCLATWKTWPTLSACKLAYSTSWDENSNYYSHLASNQGYQVWTVPTTASYTINAYGWSSLLRKWARIEGQFNLVKGEQLVIIVGQKWKRDNGHWEGWAGGTFVLKANTVPASISSVIPLIIAGWAGWRWDNGSCTSTEANYLVTAWKTSCNSKAGWTNWSDGTTTYGWKWYNSLSNLVWKNGEDGWEGWFWWGGGDQDSGDNGGWGGWYSGGGWAGAWDKQAGWGGWSYNAWANQVQWVAPSTDAHGYVIITKN